MTEEFSGYGPIIFKIGMYGFSGSGIMIFFVNIHDIKMATSFVIEARFHSKFVCGSL